jgi:uncharacterized sulfatase
MLLRVFALVSVSFLAFRGQASAVQPNIVIILADDLGWADLACYGNQFNESPHLDRLASEGVRFTQFYAGPVCSPTRANLQSGQDQARFGITQHIPGHRRPFARLVDPVVASQLPLEVETFAESLSRAGYKTGYFGKWHLGGEGFGPSQQGWGTAIELRGHTVPPNVGKRNQAHRTADFLADQAIEFMSTHRDRPFLLQISHIAVHIPLSVTEPHLERFRVKPSADGYPSRPEYAALISELDESVGRVVNEIDRLGLAEKTLILFVSDNGGLEHEQNGTVVTSNAPLRNEKGSLYEGGVRVPAIARWPGTIPDQAVCDLPLSTVDIHASVREIADAKLGREDQPVDGISFADVLRNPALARSERALYWHLPHYHHSTPGSSIRVGDWKLIEFFEDGSIELYDLGEDISEQNNLAAAHPEIAARLRRQLTQWRQDVGAKMPVPNPNYDETRAGQLRKPAKPATKD